MALKTYKTVRGVCNKLDREVPGWFKRINLSTFDISSCNNCIGASLMEVDDYSWRMPLKRAGIQTDEGECFEVQPVFVDPLLTPDWVREINKRRQASCS